MLRIRRQLKNVPNVGGGNATKVAGKIHQNQNNSADSYGIVKTPARPPGGLE